MIDYLDYTQWALLVLIIWLYGDNCQVLLFSITCMVYEVISGHLTWQYLISFTLVDQILPNSLP